MNIEKCAKKTRRKIGKLATPSITKYLLEKRGYHVLYIGTIEGDNAIEKYRLQDYIKRRAFTCSEESKLIFLHEEANHEDNFYLLLHELGHVELGHMCKSHDHDNICTERQAEVFAYFMQHPPKSAFVKILVSIITTASLCFGAFALLPSNAQQDENNIVSVSANSEIHEEALPINENTNYVYVTPTGEKYHTANCKYASLSSKRIPLEEAQEEYSPCSICKPDKN